MKRILILFVFFNLVFASQLFDIVPDARSSAIGAGVAIYNDSYAPFWNPAGIENGTVQLSISQFKQFNEMDYMYFGLARPVLIGMLALGYLQTDDVGYRQTEYVEGVPVISGSDFKVGTKSLMLSWKFDVFSVVHIGVTNKYIEENIIDAKGVGSGVDIGLLITPFSWLTIGGVVYNSNETVIIWDNGHEDVLNQKIKLGVSCKLLPQLILVADYNLDGYESQELSYGAELNLLNFIMLRGGNSKNNIYAGVGLNLLGVVFNSSYTIFSEEYFEKVYRFTIDFDLD